MVVQQLAKAGFIAEQATSRAGHRPERTVYALTDAGRRELDDWLRELVEQPEREYPAFVAALSFLSALPPADVLELLPRRLGLLAAQRAEAASLLARSAADGVPGLFLIEEEYRLAMLDAETGFINHLIERITDPETDWMALWTGFHQARNVLPRGE
jgi:hypothetical protein